MSALAKLFSKLAKELEGAPIKKATPQEWQNYLRNRGVKQEELENFEKRAVKDANYPSDRPMTKEEAQEQFRVLGDVPLRETRLSLSPKEDDWAYEFLESNNPSLSPRDLESMLIPKYGPEYSLKGAPEHAYEELVLHSPWADNLSHDPSHYTDVPGGAENIAWLRYHLLQLEGDQPKNLFHLDELQSNRHQAGQRGGYFDKGERNAISQELNKYGISDPNNQSITSLRAAGVPEDIIDRFDNYYRDIRQKAPDAPFKGDNWKNLGLRRALLEAADRDADLFSWTPGELQNQRWREQAGERTKRFYDKDLPNILRKELKAHGIKDEDWLKIKDPSGGYDVSEMPEPMAAILSRPFDDYDIGHYSQLMHESIDDPIKYYDAFKRMGMPDEIALQARRELSDYYNKNLMMDDGESQMDLMHDLAQNWGAQYLFNDENLLRVGELPAVRLTPEVRKSILEKGFPKYMLPLGAAALTDEFADGLMQEEPKGYVPRGLVEHYPYD